MVKVNVSHFIVDLANGKSHYWTKLVKGIGFLKSQVIHTDLLIQMLLFMVACPYLLFHFNGRKSLTYRRPRTCTLPTNFQIKLPSRSKWSLLGRHQNRRPYLMRQQNIGILWNFLNREKRLDIWWKRSCFLSDLTLWVKIPGYLFLNCTSFPTRGLRGEILRKRP